MILAIPLLSGADSFSSEIPLSSFVVWDPSGKSTLDDGESSMSTEPWKVSLATERVCIFFMAFFLKLWDLRPRFLNFSSDPWYLQKQWQENWKCYVNTDAFWVTMPNSISMKISLRLLNNVTRRTTLTGIQPDTKPNNLKSTLDEQRKFDGTRSLNRRPPFWWTSALSEPSSPILAVPQIVDYLCSELGASQTP